MRVLAVTAILSFSLSVLAVPVANAEITLIEPLEARSQRVNPDVGLIGRAVVDGEDSIKARGRVNTGTGRPKREAEPEAEVEALVNRGHIVPYPSTALAIPVGDLVERARGSRPGGEESAADPRKFKTAGDSRREAETVERSMKNPGGGIRDDSESIMLGSPGGHRREAHPEVWGSTTRREAVPEAKNGLNVAPGGPCPRDASPIKIPPSGCRRDAAAQPNRIGGGTSGGRRDAIPRGIRGSGANPRGVRPGNGNNQ
ncbi:uncharacterized protein J4E88_003718 [Alternaria novae-zelandiae]|uniref:uncharacterized protein n=1 Tax=Alternaria novae-zelandiae TaxID=430562 RepID=UPI0020C5ADD1|nr:uncharacterized protein J4E88_003718 [Alternaria novae-zelandiae]KAI4685881.1 hypothetical protein J4E88_003718 [Alternaria novae-zelandiae]